MATNKSPYFSDSQLLKRVKQVMVVWQNNRSDAETVAGYLADNYPEYRRRKQKGFLKQVETACSIIANGQSSGTSDRAENAQVADESAQETADLVTVATQDQPIAKEADVVKDPVPSKETVVSNSNWMIRGMYDRLANANSRRESPVKRDGEPEVKRKRGNASDVEQVDTSQQGDSNNSGSRSRLNASADSKKLESADRSGNESERDKFDKLRSSASSKRSAPSGYGRLGSYDIPIVRSTTTLSDVAGLENVVSELRRLLSHVRHPEIYSTLGVTPIRGLLLHGPPGSGKTYLAHAIAGELGVPLVKAVATELIGGVSGESEARIRDVFRLAAAHSPSVLFIDEIDAVTPRRETASREMERRIVAQLVACLDEAGEAEAQPISVGSTESENGDIVRSKAATSPIRNIIVIGATNRIDAIDLSLRRTGRFDREIRIGIPDCAARRAILQRVCARVRCAPDVEYSRLATDTPGFVAADLVAFVREAAVCAAARFFRQSDSGNAENNLRVEPFTNEDLEELKIETADFAKAQKKVQPSAKREGFLTVADVRWEEVGALQAVRAELQLAVLAPVRYASTFGRLGLARAAGILLIGPPGCGKTLLAKAVANETGINFLSVRGPELLNMYVGESERAVRVVFERARNSAPCCVFFDEIDSLCPRRSSASSTGSDGSSATARVVNQLLTELDGLEERRDVFVIGATNRPDIIDAALLRPGRFDKVLYVGLPNADERLDILRKLTRNGTRPPLAEEVSLERIAADTRCEKLTGADLSQLVREAALAAFREYLQLAAQSVNTESGTAGQTGHHALQLSYETGTGSNVAVATRHFEEALSRLRRSISEEDLHMYERMRQRWAAGISQVK